MTTTRAMLTPEVRWPGVVADRRSVNWPVLVGGLVLSLVAGHYLGPPGYALWLVSVIATIVLPGPKVRETQIHRAGNKRPYSLKHVADRMAELPATPERDSLVVGRVPVPGSQHQAAARVEAVKERYGELRSDVAYRIEHSALFDPAVEQTRDLTLLLARWDDGGASGEDTVELVREVELAFEAARAHAERVGLAHLPLEVRADADRAAKAARVASGAETDGERAAAIEQVNRLLASIALYYLPGPEEAAVALRGHRTEIRGDG